MKRFTLAIVLLTLISAAPQPKPAVPAAAVMATTDDGRRVVLLPNGTWQFVEGAAPAAPKPNSCRDAEFEELVKYFSGWPIDQVEKSGYLISTKFMTGDYSSTPPNLVTAFIGDPRATYQVSMSLVVNPDCTLTVKQAFRAVYETGPGILPYSMLEQKVFNPRVPGTNGDIVSFYTWYRGVIIDLAVIQKKHAPNAPGLAVPPPPPATSGAGENAAPPAGSGAP